MGLLPEGEVLHCSRRYSLILITVGALFLAVGLWATGTMRSRGDAGVFPYLWGSLWFLGTGAALYSGISGCIKPQVFAILDDNGIAFPSLRVPRVPWSHILSARLAPKKTTDAEGTSYVFTAPLILQLRDLGPLQSGTAALWTQGHTAPLPDGTVDWRIQTERCPLPATELLARIRTRLDPSPAPDVQSSVTSGFEKHSLSTFPNAFFGRAFLGRAFLCRAVFCGINLIVGVFVLSAAYKSWSVAEQGKTWCKTSATVESAEVVRHVSKRTLRTTVRIQILYRFTVSGQAFHGFDTHYSYNDGERRFAEGQLKDFPPGAAVAIYYDPRDPAASAFLRPYTGDFKVMAFVGGFFLLSGGLIIASRRFNT